MMDLTETPERNAEISALFDGEMETHVADTAIKRLLKNPSARGDWQTYALIGDVLRGDAPVRPDLTASVMARLDDEPIVLAPRNLKHVRVPHPMLALAASVAGVAVVGWFVMAGGTPLSGGAELLSAVAPAPTLSRSVAVSSSRPANSGPTVAALPAASRSGSDINEYLLAHHAQAPVLRTGDNATGIRTVAMNSPRP